MIIAKNIMIEDSGTVKIKKLTSSEFDLLTLNKEIQKKAIADIPNDKHILLKEKSGWIFIGVE